ncbi:glutamine amidotransferase [Bifidobacterium aquikefiri]|uniref:Glutamine amidotransferase n=2 Tax=Bifidobacterium aquikefiri TaxID=1653207 RepID=A0A261G8G4_9BIFI|nr:glutamine amidotransferase [Bifidobacterium aquikefiri]
MRIMCRLLGYATDGRNLSLEEVLGHEAVVEFREISRIHNDGWGAALLAATQDEPFSKDGGAPSPETENRYYRSTVEAALDPAFEAFARQPARGAIFHLRLASSNIPLIMENQQPFYSSGIAFSHNGDISDDDGRNIVQNSDFPIDKELFLSTGGKSDTAMYFSIVLQELSEGYPLEQAVSQAIGKLRKVYPKSSYNCLIQSRDQLVCVRASGRVEIPPRISEIYKEYGVEKHALDYRAIRYREIKDKQDKQVGVVVSSSGYTQRAEDGWVELQNNELISISNRTGEYSIRSL